MFILLLSVRPDPVIRFEVVAGSVTHSHTLPSSKLNPLWVFVFFSIVVSLFTHIPEISQSFCDIAESGSARCEKEIILYLPRIIKKIFC